MAAGTSGVRRRSRSDEEGIGSSDGLGDGLKMAGHAAAADSVTGAAYIWGLSAGALQLLAIAPARIFWRQAPLVSAG